MTILKDLEEWQNLTSSLLHKEGYRMCEEHITKIEGALRLLILSGELLAPVIGKPGADCCNRAASFRQELDSAKKVLVTNP